MITEDLLTEDGKTSGPAEIETTGSEPAKVVTSRPVLAAIVTRSGLVVTVTAGSRFTEGTMT